MSTDGDRVSVRAGVFDELQALLHLEVPGGMHDEVEALVMDADAIVLDNKPWSLFPSGPALFNGTFTSGTALEIKIRAAFSARHDLRLHCVLAAVAPWSIFFV